MRRDGLCFYDTIFLYTMLNIQKKLCANRQAPAAPQKTTAIGAAVCHTAMLSVSQTAIG